MPRYKVKMEFIYTDEVEVQADNIDDAYEKATELAEPEYSHWESGECEEIEE